MLAARETQIFPNAVLALETLLRQIEVENIGLTVPQPPGYCYVAYKTVKARFWHWLPGNKLPQRAL